MKIYIATDHRGVEIEDQIVKYLMENNFEVIRSNIPHNETDDYVDFAVDISNKVSKDNNAFGILICGTGIGMSIAANKIKGIRAAKCSSTEDAFLCRNDNNANVLCLSYKTDLQELFDIINVFISTPFSTEERHHRRVSKIIELENGE